MTTSSTSEDKKINTGTASTLEKATTPTLKGYKIVKELQRDGYGILYKALNSQGSTVWIRAISPQISNGENFLVRFELLKGLLPLIQHDNLLKIITLDLDSNIYYIVKEAPSLTTPGSEPESTTTITEAATTLSQLNYIDLPNRHETLLNLFLEIAKGLKFLEEVSNDYYKEGIIHDFLTPSHLFITQKETNTNNQKNKTIKIDGFAESFLFYGDNKESHLMHRLTTPLFHAKHFPEDSLSFFQNESLFPPSMRDFSSPKSYWHTFSFGALLYQYVTKQPPNGIFPSMRLSDPTLDAAWDELVDMCLCSPYNRGYSNMGEVVTKLEAISTSFKEIPVSVQKIKTQIPPKGMALVFIEDKVILGANDGPKVEQPLFRAKIKPFFLDTYPVSCEQFQEFLSSHKSSTYSNKDKSPVTLVSWYMAKAYCAWRSKKEGLPADTYRLPTEFEWEAAARGNSGNQYPWGDEPNTEKMHCNHSKETGSVTVDHYSAEGFGISNLLGNTWEWTESIFKPHPFSTHREKRYNNKLYVVKGGCWLTTIQDCRASLRAAFTPGEARGNISFRCARSLDQLNDTD